MIVRRINECKQTHSATPCNIISKCIKEQLLQTCVDSLLYGNDGDSFILSTQITFLSSTTSAIKSTHDPGVVEPPPLSILSASDNRWSATRMLAVLNVLKKSRSIPASVKGLATE